jgi:uncharacterized protein (TIGR02271 family)
MMEHTLVAVFDSKDHAQSALNDLASSGFSQSDIHINAVQQGSMTETDPSISASSYADHQSMGEKVKSFFHHMFGRNEDAPHADIYSEAVNRGSHVLTIDTRDDDQLNRATDILNQHHPIDVDDRVAQWRSAGWEADTSIGTGTSSRIPADSASQTTNNLSSNAELSTPNSAPGMRTANQSTRIPVVEEELQVGKREVQRGGVRVFQHIREVPVHESVHLRQEHVNVERHPLNQPADTADMAAFKEGTIELRETAEEPVVAKTAHVVEEVILSKDVGERTEDINDTVRKADVEVQQLGEQGGQAIDDSHFRTHWNTSYGQSGGRYEDYAPAYQFGSNLRQDERFKNRQWHEVEPLAQSEWQSKKTEIPWEESKDAIQAGWLYVEGL